MRSFLCWNIWIILFGITSCSTEGPKNAISIKLNLEDAVIQKIFDFRNKREATSILPYLVAENPNHRYVAALSLASVQDSTTIGDLSNALYDDYPKIRETAAFALGQIGNKKAVEPLVEAFQADTSQRMRAAILEAIGRCGTDEELKFLSTAPTYPMADTILLKGQALGLYRFMLRGMVREESVQKVINDFMANTLTPRSVRLIAAAYLARLKDANLKPHQNVLLTNLKDEKDKEVLMFLVLGVSKLQTPEALKGLKETYTKEEDYRVRCNLIRSFENFQYDSVRAIVLEGLNDTSLMVQMQAADFCYHSGNERDALLYNNLAKAHPHWLVRTRLYAASLKNFTYFKTQSKQYISQRLISEYKRNQNVYQRAAILKALGEFSWNYRFIKGETISLIDSITVPPPISTSGIEALTQIYQSPKLKKELGLSAIRVQNELNLFFQEALQTNDVAILGTIAVAIINNTDLFRTAFPDASLLKAAKQRIQAPQHIETSKQLQKAINALTGGSMPAPKVDKKFFVEIDWQALSIITPSTEIIINTKKGDIVLQLLPEYAPSAVTQFLKLTQAKYFDQKVFHRVVPNFVAQGGCSRGDGWSGLDIITPSEFGLINFDQEGLVGLASAGKDTESNQFFITYRPTPHLDGEFTIFAKVSRGMEVAHRLEVADTIQSIYIKE